MAAKRALIVDDSATARLVLGRVLTGHGIKVDGAETAEEALEFLQHHRVDVVFMDHQMPGMDGLEALQAIKANPDTAMIPVMMYTSQEGSVYVGQARALGALGVLPKQVEPVEVSQILRSLRLVDDDVEAGTAVGSTLASVTDGADGAEWRGLLEELFRQQRELLRRELRAVRASPPEPPERPETASPGAWRALSVVLMLVAAGLGLLWLDARREAPVPAPAAAPTTAPRAALEAAEPPAATGSDAAFVDALEWALGQDAGFGPEDAPFDSWRAGMLGELMARLDGLGFTGTIVLRSHLGRFCLHDSPEHGWQVSGNAARLDDCERLGWPEPDALRRGGRQTLEFANAMAGLATRYGDRMALALETAGSDSPRFAYPEPHAALDVTEWHAVAAGNQRVEVLLYPDD